MHLFCFGEMWNDGHCCLETWYVYPRSGDVKRSSASVIFAARIFSRFLPDMLVVCRYITFSVLIFQWCFSFEDIQTKIIRVTENPRSFFFSNWFMTCEIWNGCFFSCTWNEIRITHTFYHPKIFVETEARKWSFWSQQAFAASQKRLIAFRAIWHNSDF